jgi:hypothetical protein
MILDIPYNEFYQYFQNIVRNDNHWFFTPRKVGMSTCGINYILKYCSDNKTNGVYIYPFEKYCDSFLNSKNIDWNGWSAYTKYVFKKDGNSIFVTDKCSKFLYNYKNLDITIFIFDEFSHKLNFPDNIEILNDKNVKTIFLETNTNEKLIDVKRIYNNILYNKNLILHYLTINDFLNIKRVLRKEKIIELFGDEIK